MTLVRFFRPEFINQVDRYNGTASRFEGSTAKGTMPATNIMEGTDSFVLELAAPGFSKSDFSIEVNNNTLTIKGEKQNADAANVKYTRCEFGYGNFSRSFILGKAVDTNNIEAKYENGILSITLMKREEAKPKSARVIDVN